MRTIFLDSEFKCHVANSGNMIAVETDFFDNYCDTYVEGYRFIPEGENWTDSIGHVFHGCAPWKPWNELDEVQREYEKQLLIEYKNEKNELISSYTEGVNSI